MLQIIIPYVMTYTTLLCLLLWRRLSRGGALVLEASVRGRLSGGLLSGGRLSGGRMSVILIVIMHRSLRFSLTAKEVMFSLRFVCLLVCLSARLYKKLWMNFHKILNDYGINYSDRGAGSLKFIIFLNYFKSQN